MKKFIKLNQTIYRGYELTYYDMLVQYSKTHVEFGGHLLNVALYVLSNKEDFSNGFHDYCYQYVTLITDSIQNGG